MNDEKLKTFQKMEECIYRDIETEKVHKQDWDGTLASYYTNHFLITILNTCKYS